MQAAHALAPAHGEEKLEPAKRLSTSDGSQPGWDFGRIGQYTRKRNAECRAAVDGMCGGPSAQRDPWAGGVVGVQGRGGRGMSATVVLCTRMWPLNTPPPGLREPPGRAPTDDAPCASRPRPAAWRGPRYVLDRCPRRWPPHWPIGAGSRAPPPRAAIGRRRQSLKGCVDRTSVCASRWCQCHGIAATPSRHTFIGVERLWTPCHCRPRRHTAC